MRSSIHRPTVAHIHLNRILDNFQTVMSHLPDQTQAWAVVKANAYGHGAIEVAKTLQAHVTGFCVSNLDEALELREAGISQAILILGVLPVEAVALAKAQQITITVASQEWLEQVLATGTDLTDLVFHIKVDSGMGRIGFRDSDSVSATISTLLAQGAKFEGIFTHFATADERDVQYYRVQLQQFQAILADLQVQPAVVHASNSAAAIWHQAAGFSAVRLGDVLYGLNPSGRTLAMPYELRPALSLTSCLVHVKSLPAGASVGYGATYRADTPQWLGTVPIGYADGFTRDLQGFYVLIEGQACEVVGRVSMDQITVRLPHAYPLGTKVVLIGTSQSASISLQDWADVRGTINYEVACLLSDRIPREYTSD